MWPDDDGLVRVDLAGDGRVQDPALAALDDILATAGQRARGVTADERVRTVFATDLRSRLVGAQVGAPGGGTWAGGLEATPQRSRGTIRRRERRPIGALLPRWSPLAVAAAIVLAVVVLGPAAFLGGPVDAVAGDAVGATLLRDGRTQELRPGAELRDGDRVTTNASGRATLVIGGGETRLGRSTTLELIQLDRHEVRLDQQAGRAWHRVGAAVGAYTVTTGDLRWIADGTAFDVALDGADRVAAVAADQTVRVAGPDIVTAVHEGSAALIGLQSRAGGRPLVVGPLTATDLADPWLITNARRDVELGFRIGIPDWPAVPTVTPTTGPTPDATPRPTEAAGPAEPATVAPAATSAPRATPKPTAKPSPRPTAKATPKPTPKATPNPTPKPTPALGTLSLDVVACHGGFAVLAWSKAPADGFGHYQSLRSSSSTIKPVYPPVAPAIAPDSLFVPDRLTLDAVDVDVGPGTVHYRTIAFGPGDDPIAASPVRTVTIKGTKDLGALAAVVEGGSVALGWTPYGGPEACFSATKVAISTTDETPSYLDGSDVAWTSESQSADEAVLDGLAPGTYYVRVQVVRSTDSGKRLVAQTDVATVTIP